MAEELKCKITVKFLNLLFYNKPLQISYLVGSVNQGKTSVFLITYIYII